MEEETIMNEKKIQKLFWVLWPSFLVAGLAESVFFTVIDPQELYLLGQEVHFSRIATYSLGFFGFWAICAASSMMTIFLQKSAAEINNLSRSKHPTRAGGAMDEQPARSLP
jgi:hypothetical protein